MALSPVPAAAVSAALDMAAASFAADSAIESIVYDLDLVDGTPHGLFHFFGVYRAGDGSAAGHGFYASDDAASLALINRRAFL